MTKFLFNELSRKNRQVRQTGGLHYILLILPHEVRTNFNADYSVVCCERRALYRTDVYTTEQF